MIMLTIDLILSAIVMEFLPEEEAKLFVVPTMIAALFVEAAQLVIFRKHHRHHLIYPYPSDYL
jgi:hypothetical protein